MKIHSISSKPPGLIPGILVAFAILAVLLTLTLRIVSAKLGGKSVAKRFIRATESNSNGVVFAAVDTSLSNRKALPTETEDAAKLTLALDPDRNWEAIFRFDSEVQELYSGVPYDSDEAFLTDLTPKFALRSQRDNTYLDTLFDTLDKRIHTCKGNSVIVVATDGYCEGMISAQHRRVTASAKRLAGCGNLIAVYFVGVNPANTAMIRNDLAPLGDRLQFVSPGTLDVGLISGLLTREGTHAQ